MKRAFVDTGYLLAVEIRTDQHHPAALAHWERVRQERWRLTTTSFVFDEVVTFLNSRGRHDRAVWVGELLLHSPEITMVHVDAILFADGWRRFRARPDKRYSLTDCVSFVVMEREGLHEALAFDTHFTQAAFNRLP